MFGRHVWDAVKVESFVEGIGFGIIFHFDSNNGRSSELLHQWI